VNVNPHVRGTTVTWKLIVTINQLGCSILLPAVGKMQPLRRWVTVAFAASDELSAGRSGKIR
jgi:hypothetical protein